MSTTEETKPSGDDSLRRTYDAIVRRLQWERDNPEEWAAQREEIAARAREIVERTSFSTILINGRHYRS